MIEIARAHGAAVDLTDQAVWIPTSVPPDGPPLMNVPDLPKPHCILVDGAGRRFVDEAQSYMANGQDFYAHGAVPAHAIMDASYFSKYSWGFRIDRKGVVKGKSVSVRVDLGGRRIIKKKKTT